MSTISEYIPTGVVGLDYVLMGGMLRQGFYLLQGDPGSGKTTLALQFILGRMRAGGRCLYITLTESRRDLENTCRTHGWSLDGLSICDLTQSAANLAGEPESSVFHPSETELGETTQAVLAAVAAAKPEFVVFDGLSEMRLLAGNALIYRRQLLALKEYFAEQHATVLLLDDRSSAFGSLQPESLVGGNANLDAMLQGGLAAGSTTLMIGPAGAGKSTIAMLYATAAMKNGIKAAAYIFDEVLDTLVDRTEKLCLSQVGGVREFIRTGLLHVQQIDPAELSPGAFAHEVRRTVDAGARIVIIDSLNGYMNAMPEERFLTTHLHELFSYLNQKGVITIVVVSQHGMIVGTASGGDVDVSYLADTVLLFRYFESHGEIHQALSVFKKRTGSHERTLRHLEISEKGVAVGDPLRQFRGILTGVPQYESSGQLVPEKEPQ